MTGALTGVTAEEAWADYRTAAAAAGVSVRTVSVDDAWAAVALLEEIWKARPVEAALLISLAHTGGYAVVAVDAEVVAGDSNEEVASGEDGEKANRDSAGRDAVLGAAAGYFAQPVGTALHSHVAGVRPGIERPGVGRAMKLHQRAWCLDLGVTEVTWTFDPLVARNAHINLTRLGADFDEYLVDFYGVMTDGINAGQGSDRAVLRWHLTRPYLPIPRGGQVADQHGGPPGDQCGSTQNSASAEGTPGADLRRAGTGDVRHDEPVAAPALVVAPDGAPRRNPVPASGDVTLAIPRDIEGLRATDPAQASAWRTALRETMTPLLADGWRVTGFEPATGYLVERPTP
ncbi:hypothetical protein [Demequina aurantiaca]|uniref:hypothetical protein n=1 Tax=Demequina aurantiaca TaxID=676200 RepID=UPI003D33624B